VSLNWLPKRHAAPATRGRARGGDTGGDRPPNPKPDQTRSPSPNQSPTGRGFPSPSPRKSPIGFGSKSPSPRESPIGFGPESTSPRGSPIFFYPRARVHGRVRFRWTWESDGLNQEPGSKKSDSLCASLTVRGGVIGPGSCAASRLVVVRPVGAAPVGASTVARGVASG
jgi:hypothetical protein